MHLFSSNPIVVRKKGGQLVGIIELDYDHETMPFCLEVLDKNKDIIFDGRVEHDTFITVDLYDEVLHLIYKNVDNQEIILEKEIHLSHLFPQNNLSTFTMPISNSTHDLYQMLVQRVKEEMDNPTGSEFEKKIHTKMLNESTINKRARDYVTKKIHQIVSEFDQLTDQEIVYYSKKIYNELYGMGILQEIDDDPDVGEIMVNGFVYPKFRCEIYYVKNGKKIKYDKTFKDLDDLLHVFSRSIAYSKKELNSVENAIIEATRSNGDRVNLIIPDASESYVLNIRKFSNFIPNRESMLESGTIDPTIDGLMRVLVRGKANIGIGGQMATGKTTFINYLLSYTNPEERKVVISSVAEIDTSRVLKGHDIVVLRVDEEKGFTFDKLMRASLRTTADRIIIPESRGGEFRQVYEANLRTKGNMFTAHALDDESFLDMCVDMYAKGETVDIESVRNRISNALDIIVIMRKVGENFRIKSISEVVKNDKHQFEKMNVLYYWKPDKENTNKGDYVRTSNRLTNRLKEQLNEYGVPMSELEQY